MGFLVEIKTLSEFQEAFPNYSFLEGANGFTRYSNGKAPDSNYESAWFDNETELLVASPELIDV